MQPNAKQLIACLLGGIWVVPAVGAVGADTSDQLEPIVVIGQKENQEIERAPEAITAISAEALKLDRVNDVEDLNGLVPGLVIGETEGYNHNVAIRGVGLNSPQDDGSPASVSFHQNGIFISSPVSLGTDFLDVDHIEVLRGPQGTVFGQNSVGGTINVITVMPTFDATSGYADFSTGSYNLVHGTFAVNIPLAPTFAVRIAADLIRQDGYAKETEVGGTNGDYPLSDKHNSHVRLTALLQPNDDFSVVGIIEYSKANQHEAEGKNLIDPNPSPYQETNDWPGTFNYNQTVASGIVTYNFEPVVFKSLSSLQYVNQGGSISETGLDIPLATAQSGGENIEFYLHDIYALTQELDLSSKPGGPFDWVVGGFFLHSRTTDAYAQYLRNAEEPGAPDTIGIPDPAAEAIATPELLAGTLYFETANAFRRDSVSEFGQTTYHINDALRATAGFRYTVDKNTTFLDNYYGDPSIGGGLVHLEQRASKLTWKTELDYQATPANFVYGSVSTGFKPGGGNPGTAPEVVPAQYKPETITAFEVGSKNTFLDNRFVANIAGFYYQDSNLQYHAEDVINFDGGVDNLPRVDIYGLELEFNALLPDHFKVSGNLTDEKGRIATHIETIDNLAGNALNNQFAAQYGETAFIDAEFGIPDPALPNAQQLLTALRYTGYRDVYGNSPPNLPQYTANLAVAQTSTFQDGSSLLSRLSATYRDHYADTVFGNTPIYTTPSYVLMNLLFDYTFSNRTLDLTFAITNLADRVAVSYRFTNQYGGETTQGYYPPREFIGGIRYKF
ncbi:MAG: TonB-dependent receptor [Steroidobacteraceae bacterium]